MKITHFHGMSEKAYSNWIKYGDKGSNSSSSPWVCSDNDGYTYLWSLDKLDLEYSTDDTEELEQIAKSRAWESAQLQAAIDGSRHVYLFALSLDPEDYEDDDSCENMQECDKTEQGNLNQTNIVSIYKVEFNQYLAPFVISSIMDFDLFNKSIIDPLLLKTAKIVSSLGYLDELTEYPYHTETKVTI